MARIAEQPAATFTVEALAAEDHRATDLWHELHGPNCAGTKPPHSLIAREQQTGRILGIAQYFRTFPPEDACSAVLVLPEALHTGAGEQLFQRMAAQALKDGIRNLGTLVSHDDYATLDLLRNAGAPVRISPMHGGLYVEIDVLTFTALPPQAQAPGRTSAPNFNYTA